MRTPAQEAAAKRLRGAEINLDMSRWGNYITETLSSGEVVERPTTPEEDIALRDAFVRAMEHVVLHGISDGGLSAQR